jgi:hypothetical protein
VQNFAGLGRYFPIYLLSKWEAAMSAKVDAAIDALAQGQTKFSLRTSRCGLV